MSSSANNWYFTKEELSHGKTAEELKEETSRRRSSCAFLQEAGMRLRLPQLTIATAIVFFHRFYVYNSFKDYSTYIIGTTCLFLAGKVEETPKKLRDVIEATHEIQFKKQIVAESQDFAALRERILTHELTVLRVVAFDLTVEHPYKYLLSFVKLVNGKRDLAQVAWNFVNDSLRTTLCLQFKPSLIASAAIYLAARFLKCQLPEGKGGRPWYEVLEVREQDLKAISDQILELYESSPNVEAIKSQTLLPITQSPSDTNNV